MYFCEAAVLNPRPAGWMLQSYVLNIIKKCFFLSFTISFYIRLKMY